MFNRYYTSGDQPSVTTCSIAPNLNREIPSQGRLYGQTNAHFRRRGRTPAFEALALTCSCGFGRITYIIVALQCIHPLFIIRHDPKSIQTLERPTNLWTVMSTQALIPPAGWCYETSSSIHLVYDTFLAHMGMVFGYQILPYQPQVFIPSFLGHSALLHSNAAPPNLLLSPAEYISGHTPGESAPAILVDACGSRRQNGNANFTTVHPGLLR